MDYKKLYLKSFIVALVLIFIGAAILSPRLGLAQGGPTNVDQGPDFSAEPAAREPSLLTDHPEGMLFDVKVDDQIPTTNLRDVDLSFQGEEVTPPLLEQNNLDDRPETSTLDGVMLEGMDAERDSTAGSRWTDALTIPAADFRSDGQYPDGYFFWFSGGHLYNTVGWNCYMAPVYVPHGVTLEGIWATIYDNSATDYIWLDLYRLNNFTGVPTKLATAETSAAYTSPNVNTHGTWGLTETVVYPDHSYYIGTCINGTSISLYSVRVYYTQ